MSDLSDGLSLLDRWALTAPSIPQWYMPLSEAPPFPTTFCSQCAPKPNERPAIPGVVWQGAYVPVREMCPHDDHMCNDARMRAASIIEMLCKTRMKETAARETTWNYAWARMQMKERGREE